MITEFKKSSLLLIFLGALNDIYANPPIYAKATTDVAFKQLLDPSIGQDVMLSFLNTFVPCLKTDPATKVEAAPITVPALPRKGDEKLTFMNMHVTSKSGAHFVIEMQALRHLFFDERALYYACNTYGRQLSESQLKEDFWYHQLKPTIAIQVLDYDTNKIKGIQESGDAKDTLVPNVKNNPMKAGEYIKHFKFIDIHSNQSIDHVQMIQIELPRYKSEAELYPPKKNFTEKDWWFSILRYAHKYTNEDLKLLKDSKTKVSTFVKNALGRLEYEKWNPQMQHDQQIQALNLGNYKTMLDAERAEGEARGEAKSKAKIIIKCHSQNMTIDVIADIVTLPKAEVKKIIEDYQAKAKNKKKHRTE